MTGRVFLHAHTIRAIKVCFLLLAILLWIVILYLYSTKHTLALPQKPPIESNRVVFQDETRGSYSIICPEEWSHRVGIDITLQSRSTSSFAPPLAVIVVLGSLTLTDEEVEKELKNRKEIIFQNEPAYYELSIFPPRKMLGRSEYQYSLFFKREEKWYLCSYSTTLKLEEMPPPIIWEYFNTFRIEGSENSDDSIEN